MSGPRIPRPSAVANIAERRWSDWAASHQLADQVEQQKRPVRDGNLGRNDGTIDPQVMPLLRGAARIGELASEPAHYKHGYQDGWRAGVWQALFLGFLLGASTVGIALQLGLAIGGAS